MVFRSLLRRKARSALTVLGIAIGIAAVVALGAIAEGLADAYTGIIGKSSADLVVTQAGAAELSVSAVDESDAQTLRAIPGITDVAPMLLGIVPVQGVPYFIVFGHAPDSFAIRHFRVVEGRPLSSRPAGGEGKEIVLGRLAANNLKKHLGESLALGPSTFRIVGIFETGVAYEEGGAVASVADIQAVLSKPRQVTAYFVRLKDTGDSEAVRARIERQIPKVTAASTTDFADKQQEIQLTRAFAWGLALLAVLVGGLGMMNTVLMSVFERTREIGVLRALGWRRRRVVGLILQESLVLSVVGGLLGTALGVLAVVGLGQLPSAGTLLQGKFTLDLFVRALLVAVSLGGLAALCPAWRAASLLPVEALRYEGGSGDRVPRFLPGGMAIKGLFRRRTRTLLTVAGIGVGIGTVVALNGVIGDFYSSFNQVANGTDLMVTQADVSSSYYSGIDEQVGKQMRAYPEVTSVSGIIYGVASTKELAYMILFGYHPAEPAIRRFKVTDGRDLTGSHEILLGAKAAEKMHRVVGDTIRVLGSTFRIVGLFETGLSYEDYGGVVSLRDAQTMFRKPRQVSFYAVALKDPNQAEAVRQQMLTEFDDLTVSLSSRFSEDQPDMAISLAMVNALSAVAYLIGGVVMMNTIVMSVLERTRELGVLRSLGWRRRQVMGLILRESVVLSLLSGVAGIGLGIGLVRLLMLDSTYAGLLQGRFSIESIVHSLAAAVILGAISGLYPAWRATTLNPIEALRYE